MGGSNGMQCPDDRSKTWFTASGVSVNDIQVVNEYTPSRNAEILPFKATPCGGRLILRRR